MHLAYIWIVSHLSAKNYRNLWKFDVVLTKTNLLSFFGTRCIYLYTGYTVQCQSLLQKTHMHVNSVLKMYNTVLTVTVCS